MSVKDISNDGQFTSKKTECTISYKKGEKKKFWCNFQSCPVV